MLESLARLAYDGGMGKLRPSLNTVAAAAVVLICTGGLWGAVYSFRTVSGYITAVRLADEAAAQYGDQEYDPPEIDCQKDGSYYVWYRPKSRSGQFNVLVKWEGGKWAITNIVRNGHRVEPSR